MELENIIVIDIETVPQKPSFELLSTHWKQLWSEKVSKVLPDGMSLSDWYLRRAGVMAEFSKVICISIGFYLNQKSSSYKVVSIYGNDEISILSSFIDLLNKLFFIQKKKIIAGHNIKEFDIPFICRRLMVHKIPVPAFMNIHLQKPWEQNLLDTFQMWKFGDYKHYTSLHLLASVLNVPSPKTELDGSMIAPLFWEENPIQQELNMLKIIEYCGRDVIATMNIILRFQNKELLQENTIHFESILQTTSCLQD